jgi:4-hydroxy-tetrahydrodipicolinate reductase
MPTTIKVAQFGLGPIGLEALRLAASRGLDIVGAVDIDEAKVGRSLAEIAGVASLRERRVFRTFDELARRALPDVVLHTAGSRALVSLEQMLPMVERGVSVASTCEELIFPALTADRLAREVDAVARRAGARLVGTGVNPGFVLDVLPICLTGVCKTVRAVRGERVVDATTRRQPLQAKIGSGMPPDLFREKFRRREAGHAGFRESVALVAHALGWRLDAIEETCEPVVAERRVVTPHFTVEPGATRGLRQRARGVVGGRDAIVLDLEMSLEAPDPHDAVWIDGEPPLEVRVAGGTAGDVATVANLLNAVPRLLAARPGLLLPTDLPLAAPADR